jgi:hypothetical protein
MVLDPILQISAARIRQDPIVHHLAAEQLNRDELNQDPLPRSGVADLGLEALLDRIGKVAGLVRRSRSEGDSRRLSAAIRRFLRRAIESSALAAERCS